ncbi:MAG: hypothetical protein WC781_04490 [Candidatus Pacearchaeota archaeon]|jgi:hypothetical protein
MYNADFAPQMENFRTNLFGTSAIVSSQEIAYEFSRAYYLPENIDIIPCHEDVNGEWVPEKLENML